MDPESQQYVSALSYLKSLTIHCNVCVVDKLVPCVADRISVFLAFFVGTTLRLGELDITITVTLLQLSICA